MEKALGLRSIAIWNAFRMVLTAFLVFEDLLVIAKSGDPGGYALVATRKLILTISVLPSQIASVIAYLESGRHAALFLDLLWTALYGLVAFGLLRGTHLVRRLCIAWYVVESLSLLFFLTYLLPSFWSVWPHEVTAMSIYIIPTFLVFNGLALFVLIGPSSKIGRVGDAPVNEATH